MRPPVARPTRLSDGSSPDPDVEIAQHRVRIAELELEKVRNDEREARERGDRESGRLLG